MQGEPAVRDNALAQIRQSSALIMPDYCRIRLLG